MTRTQTLSQRALGLFALASVITCVGATVPPEVAVPFHRVPTATYASFVNNWDDATHPFLCAVIDSETSWSRAFSPALTMSPGHRRISPGAPYFEHHWLMLLAMVQSVDIPEKAWFTDLQVSRDTRGRFRGVFNAPVASTAITGAKIKAFALLSFDRADASPGQVDFELGQQTICTGMVWP